MGLREKVALIITVTLLIQTVFVTGTPERKTIKDDDNRKNQKRSLATALHPLATKTKYPYLQGLKTKRKQLSETSQEIFRKAFNFPDVEYPTASTPRPPYYLQESNIVQRNLIPQTSRSLTNPSSTFSVDGNSINMKYKNKKKQNLAKLKQTNRPGTTNTLSDPGTSAKPYHKQILFPEVEYPLSAMETWKSKYWQQMPSYGQRKNEMNNVPNCPVDTDIKLGSRLFKKKFGAAPKIISSKKTNHSTKSPVQVSTTAFPVPLTPSMILDTTPLCTDKRTDENTTSAPIKKSVIKKDKKKKKSLKKKNSTTPIKNDTSKENCGAITTPSHSDASVLQELLLITKTQDNLINVMPDEPRYNVNLGELDTRSNIPNQTVSSIYVATTMPPYVSGNNVPSISPSKIRNDDKMPVVSCDNKVGSLSDAINTVVFENTDNKDSCFEDNVINSNKSLAFDVDEEFTTDVFPDFNENMLYVSTSTMSPMTLDIDEAWANSVVIDPYKFVAYSDELEQCYIAVP